MVEMAVAGQCLKDIHFVSRIKQHDSDTLSVVRISKQHFE